MDKKGEELFELTPDKTDSDSASTEVAVAASTEVAVAASTEAAVAKKTALTGDEATKTASSEKKQGKKNKKNNKKNNKTGASKANSTGESLRGNEPDDFAEEIEALEHEKEDEEIIKNLSESINRQVEIDLVNRSIIDDDGAKQNVADAIETEKNPVRAFLKKIPKWCRILSGIIIGIGIVVLILACTGLGEKLLIKLGSKYVADKVNYVAVATLPPDEIDTEAASMGDEATVTEAPEVSATPVPEPSATPEPTPTPVPEIEKKIVNILLIGEENIDSYSSRGRTDSIIIATIDTRTNSLKFTSVMRDCLVDIPDFDKNRINAAYAIGGVAKMYEVLQANLGITPDNYALVRFSDFERIVDAVGGIDITLSAKEASYLNRTNYISKVENRNVVEGLNHMNGNQALGYCRVRKVATKENVNNDFGRTSRHREVISAIFEQVKNRNYLELIGIANTCLPFVTTDLSSEQIEEYLNMLVTIGGMNVRTEEMRIPEDKTYSYADYKGMSVIEVNFEKNREALHKFIYGE